DCEGDAAEGDVAGVLGDSGDPERTYRPVHLDADLVTDAEVLLLRGGLVDHDLVRTGRPRPGYELRRVEAHVRLRIERKAEPRRIARADQLALGVDEADGLAVHRPGGEPDVRQRTDLRQHRVGERRRLDLVAVAAVRERGLAADDHVRVPVLRLEDRVEAVVDRVRQDVGAADHRHAENDRESDERRPELARRKPLQRYGEHQSALSSSIAAITALGSERGRSRTISPSARKRIRSAIAAACGSWVTIMVVCP